MADHKTMIGGTTYKVGGGRTLIGGTTYNIKEGKTLIGGTTKSITFIKEVPAISNGAASMAYTSRSWNMLSNPNTTYSWAEAGSPYPFSIRDAVYDGSVNGIIFPLNVVGSTVAPTPTGGSIPVSYGESAYGFFGPLNLAETPKITINCIAAVVNPGTTDGKWVAISASAVGTASLKIGYAATIPSVGTTTESKSPGKVIVWESEFNTHQISNISYSTFADYQYTIPSVSSGSQYLVISASTNVSVFVKSLTLSN